MSAIRAVTLDAAGTLFEVREAVGNTYARLARSHGIPVDSQDLTRAFRTVFPRMSPLAFGKGDAARRERQERDWWRTLVRNCLGAQGQHPSFSAFFDELYAFYASPDAWRLYPEVPEVLDAMDTAGIPVIVVSNFDSRLHGVLTGLGVHGRFRAVLCSSEAGTAKPGAGIFLAACEAFAEEPARVLHAGDDRRADFDGARAAGLQARWLRRSQPATQQAGAISDLGQITELAAQPG